MAAWTLLITCKPISRFGYGISVSSKIYRTQCPLVHVVKSQPERDQDFVFQ